MTTTANENLGIFPGNILDVRKWTSYAAAFKSYLLTDRHKYRRTESTEIINHAAWRVVNNKQMFMHNIQFINNFLASLRVTCSHCKCESFILKVCKFCYQITKLLLLCNCHFVFVALWIRYLHLPRSSGQMSWSLPARNYWCSRHLTTEVP